MNPNISNHTFGYSYARVNNGQVSMVRVGDTTMTFTGGRRVYSKSVISFRRSFVARLLRSYFTNTESK